MKVYVNSLEDEKICDFLVPSKIKKVWNVEIDIFENIKLICDKYHLTYFAIGGTLLGAIRHKGFIPWDDDLDIGMPREDYNKFLEVVDQELPDYLFAQTYLNTRSFPYDMIKVRNSETTGFTPWEKNEKCNKGIFVDIFPIDKFSNDEQVRNTENEEVKKLLYIATILSRKTESEGKIRHIKSFIKSLIRALGGKSKVSIISKAIKICSRYNDKETEYCGMRSFSCPERFLWKCNSCMEFIEVPFEKTTIKVPAGYDEILKTIYGDYHVFVKADSFHEGAVFDPNTPYELYKY